MPRQHPASAASALRPAALLLCLAAGAAVAQVPREQAVHAHGITSITLAVVEGTFELQLSAPGMDLVGFEHAPGDSQQAQAIAAANATLERSGDWLAFEPAGSCVVTSADAHTHGFEDEASAGDAGTDAAGHAGHGGDHENHDHDHDHDNDDHDHAGGHGEFHLTLKGTCSATPQALQLDLASRFAGIETIRVDLITDSAQDRVELGAGQTRVPLAR